LIAQEEIFTALEGILGKLDGLEKVEKLGELQLQVSQLTSTLKKSLEDAVVKMTNNLTNALRDSFTDLERRLSSVAPPSVPPSPTPSSLTITDSVQN